MRYNRVLIRGVLRQRYKRFLADVELQDGLIVTAHCPNPGSMLGLAPPGASVWLLESSNPARKLPYTWELVAVNDTLVGINTMRPNQLAAEAINMGVIPELAGYKRTMREVAYGRNSRIDFLLTAPTRPDCFVEVKNVNLMRRTGSAEFPDSVTKRGTKHLVELTDIARAGQRALMLYVVQRGDCKTFSLAADIDPHYAQAFDQALAVGVEAACYACTVTVDGIDIVHSLPISS